MKLTHIALALGALTMLAAGAACGGGTSTADKTSTAAARSGRGPATALPRASTTIAAGSAQKQLTITAKDFEFSAPALDVSKGDTIAITFKNTGSATHTLAFFSDEDRKTAIPGADTGSVSGGATKTLTVTVDKGLYYRCNIHPTQMQGEIEIK